MKRGPPTPPLRTPPPVSYDQPRPLSAFATHGLALVLAGFAAVVVAYLVAAWVIQ